MPDPILHITAVTDNEKQFIGKRVFFHTLCGFTIADPGHISDSNNHHHALKKEDATCVKCILVDGGEKLKNIHPEYWEDTSIFI